MKAQILFFLLIISFAGCKKSSELELTPSKSLIGTWELVESVGSWTINGSTASLNESKTGKRLIFNTDGTCTVDNFTNYEIQVKGSILILKEINNGREFRREVNFTVDANTLTLTKNLDQFIAEFTVLDPNANKSISAANLKSTFRRLQGSELTTPVATEVKIGEAKSFQILTFETTGDTLKTNEYVGKISNEDVKLIKVAKNKLSVLVLDTWKDGKVELTIPVLGTTKYTFTKVPTTLAGTAESIINQKFDKLAATSVDIKNTQIDKSLTNIKTYLAGLNDVDKEMVAQFIQNNPELFSETNIINGRLFSPNEFNYPLRLNKFKAKVLLISASTISFYVCISSGFYPGAVASAFSMLISVKQAIDEHKKFQNEKFDEIDVMLEESGLSLRKGEAKKVNGLSFQVDEEKTLKGNLLVGNLTAKSRANSMFVGFFETMDSMFSIFSNINSAIEKVNTFTGKTLIEKIIADPLNTEANPVNVAMTAEQTKGLTISCPSKLVNMKSSLTTDGKIKITFSKSLQNFSTDAVTTTLDLKYKGEFASFDKKIDVVVNIQNPLVGEWTLFKGYSREFHDYTSTLTNPFCTHSYVGVPIVKEYTSGSSFTFWDDPTSQNYTEFRYRSNYNDHLPWLDDISSLYSLKKDSIILYRIWYGTYIDLPLFLKNLLEQKNALEQYSAKWLNKINSLSIIYDNKNDLITLTYKLSFTGVNTHISTYSSSISRFPDELNKTKFCDTAADLTNEVTEYRSFNFEQVEIFKKKK